MNPQALSRLMQDPLARAARAALSGTEEAWVVGGAVRDLALGAGGALTDLDLAVLGPAAPYARRLAKRLGAAFVTLDADNEVYRLVLPPAAGSPGRQVDVARVQGPAIEADLGRRDFTVNAMAVPLSEGRPALLDPFGGLADASARALKAVRAEAFDEDPLRTLRVFRIAAQCGLTPEARTVAWAKARRKLLSKCASERVRTEVMGVLSNADSARWLRAMDGAGLLTTVFPELEASRRCALAYYGKGGVLTHALATVERTDFLLGSLERVWPAHAAGVRQAFAAAPGGSAGHAALLRLGALLHDVAKPETAKRRGERLRFFGHEAVGAERSTDILERLRFSREETDWVGAWVLNHLRPGNLAANEAVTDKAVYRFFRDLGPKGVSQLVVCWADHSSYLDPESVERGLAASVQEPGSPLPRWAKGDTAKTLHHLRVVHLLLDRWFRSPAQSRPERLLDGNAVMKALKLKPGPEVGELLRALEEAQAEGKVRTRAEALSWLRSGPSGR